MESGKLYIIATPIGNLEDITLRALRILKDEAKILFCEDTRQTMKLLKHYEIDSQVFSLHAHSTELKLKSALKFLEDGKSIGYVTDAGTPCISDPGYKLVEAARTAGFQVVPIPGPAALSTIVSVCGLPASEIYFAGFISKKPGRRINELTALKEIPGIIVFYESPHRIIKLIEALNVVFPDNELVIGRELTKFHEEIIHNRVSEIYKNLDKLEQRGEFTLALYNPIK